MHSLKVPLVASSVPLLWRLELNHGRLLGLEHSKPHLTSSHGLAPAMYYVPCMCRIGQRQLCVKALSQHGKDNIEGPVPHGTPLDLHLIC